MMPSLGLIRIPGRRGVPPIPIPLFLLWPVALIGLGVTSVFRSERHRRATRLRTALQLFWQLRGLSIDVDTREHKKIHIRFV